VGTRLHHFGEGDNSHVELRGFGFASTCQGQCSAAEGKPSAAVAVTRNVQVCGVIGTAAPYQMVRNGLRSQDLASPATHAAAAATLTQRRLAARASA
jgi:hypothetical protein